MPRSENLQDQPRHKREPVAYRWSQPYSTVRSTPGVGEAAANRRATETNLRQTQSTLLPQVHIDASTGPEKFNQMDITPPPQGNNSWLSGSTNISKNA